MCSNWSNWVAFCSAILVFVGPSKLLMACHEELESIQSFPVPCINQDGVQSQQKRSRLDVSTSKPVSRSTAANPRMASTTNVRGKTTATSRTTTRTTSTNRPATARVTQPRVGARSAATKPSRGFFIFYLFIIYLFIYLFFFQLIFFNFFEL